MALLRQSALLLMGALAAGGCSQAESLGHAELWLRECADCALSGELHRVAAYFDTQSSRHAPRGFYAYFELERTNGARGILELDVPTAGAGAPFGPEQVSYRETLNGRVLFEAQQVQGTLQLPAALVQPEIGSCGCDDALFQLQFRAADEVRELRYGHLSREQQSCGALPASKGAAGMSVVLKECGAVVEPIGAPRVSTSTSAGSLRPSSSARRCDRGDCNDEGSYNAVEVGCGSSEPPYDDGTRSSGGCVEDSASSSSSSSSSQGCSDSSKHDDHESGCEGDTSDSPSSCSVMRRPANALRSFMGTGLPLLLVCLWQALRAARLRKQSR